MVRSPPHKLYEINEGDLGLYTFQHLHLDFHNTSFYYPGPSDH